MFCSVFSVLIIIGLFAKKTISKEKISDEVPYMQIEYKIPINNYCSCLSFFEDNSFSEFDCDSETTDMPFTGEYYDKYYYNKDKKIIIFKGKNVPPVEAEVLKWTEEKFEIKVLNSHKNNKKCSSNNKDIYSYLVSKLTKSGYNLKQYITDNKGENLKITYWDRVPYNNFGEECSYCNHTSTDYIISKIEDNKNYDVSIDYEDGKISQLSISITQD